MVYCGIKWYIVVRCGILRDIVVHCGILWYIVEHCGILWDIVVHCCTLRYIVAHHHWSFIVRIDKITEQQRVPFHKWCNKVDKPGP